MGQTAGFKQSPISLVKYKFIFHETSSLVSSSSLLKLPNDLCVKRLTHIDSAV